MELSPLLYPVVATLIAALLGAAIGAEREWRRHPGGLRSPALVAAACVSRGSPSPTEEATPAAAWGSASSALESSCTRAPRCVDCPPPPPSGRCPRSAPRQAYTNTPKRSH